MHNYMKIRNYNHNCSSSNPVADTNYLFCMNCTQSQPFLIVLFEISGSFVCVLPTTCYFYDLLNRAFQHALVRVFAALFLCRFTSSYYLLLVALDLGSGIEQLFHCLMHHPKPSDRAVNGVVDG